MRSATQWVVIAVCTLAAACSGGGGAATPPSDPSGDWALALLVTAGTGDGATNVDSARLFTLSIQPSSGGSSPYDVVLAEAGGGTYTLGASVDGDQLRLSGSLPWPGMGASGTASVLSSAVSIRDSILFGTVDAQLTAGASGTETWYFSAYDDSVTGIPVLGWWQLDAEVVYATGDFAASVGEIQQTILFIGPQEFLFFVVGWMRSDGIWGGVTAAQGFEGTSLSGWSREHSEAGMTWTETIDSFHVEAVGGGLEQRTIELLFSGDKNGEQTWLYTGSPVVPGTTLTPLTPIWAERFNAEPVLR